MAKLPVKPDALLVTPQGDDAVKVTVRLEKQETSFVICGVKPEEVHVYHDSSALDVVTEDGAPLQITIRPLTPFYL